MNPKKLNEVEADAAEHAEIEMATAELAAFFGGWMSRQRADHWADGESLRRFEFRRDGARRVLVVMARHHRDAYKKICKAKGIFPGETLPGSIVEAAAKS